MSVKKVLLAIILLPILLLVGIFAYVVANNVSGTWHYKMTIEIETPEGVKSSSAVHEVSNSATNIKILDFPEGGNPAEFKGEAVVINMGEGEPPLFAVLGSDPEYIFYHTFPVPGGGPTTVNGIKYYNSLDAGLKKDAPIKYYPKLVTFTDMNDPKSVKLVLAAEKCFRGTLRESECKEHGPYIATDYLEELFGAGVKLKDITLEVTDEPTTWGVVDQYLPKNFNEVIIKNWRSLKTEEKKRMYQIVTFKQGEPQ